MSVKVTMHQLQEQLPALLARTVLSLGSKPFRLKLSSSAYTGHEFTVDHVIPTSHGGTDDFNNLCLGCFWCNNYKQARTEAVDIRTGRVVPLFNPRTDNWHDLFR